MAKARSVYLLTLGDYSDYAVYGVYTNKKVAEKLARVYSFNIEERALNECLDKINMGLLPYIVSTDKNEISCYGPGINENMRNDVILFANGAMNTCLWAEDEEHAKKIAQDRFAELKWLNDTLGITSVDYNSSEADNK